MGRRGSPFRQQGDGLFYRRKHLNRFIEGKCVSDIKLIHDQMLGATMYYSGSGGLVMNTISCGSGAVGSVWQGGWAAGL